MYNLVNMVEYPTRITHNTSSLTDVMITKNVNFEKKTLIYDVGYSGHLAQIVYIKVRQTNTSLMFILCIA
jgi:hypothetical protein